MEFCCPKCVRVEEIILDRKPICLVCHEQMVPASDYSELWMSPYVAVTRMITVRETYGRGRARNDRRFKKEREGWVTGIFALAIEKLSGKEWWVEIETADCTPDTRLRQIDQSSGQNVIQTMDIEVVDWEENVDDIMEVIEKKCKRAYPSNYSLLVYARHSGKLLDFDLIIEKMTSAWHPMPL